MSDDDIDYLALLKEADNVIKDLVVALITVEGNLNKPYPERPEWSPWTRWVTRPFRQAGEFNERLRPILRAAECIHPAKAIRRKGPGGNPGLYVHCTACDTDVLQGRFCYEHWSWLCTRGQGKCQEAWAGGTIGDGQSNRSPQPTDDFIGPD
jgi:hypothetical protein